MFARPSLINLKSFIIYYCLDMEFHKLKVNNHDKSAKWKQFQLVLVLLELLEFQARNVNQNRLTVDTTNGLNENGT